MGRLKFFVSLADDLFGGVEFSVRIVATAAEFGGFFPGIGGVDVLRPKRPGATLHWPGVVSDTAGDSGLLVSL